MDVDGTRARMIGDKEPRPRAYDAIIIGSGMSGMTAAVILAKEGLRVLVLEQHYRPGGYLHRFHRKGGIKFDVGFHYMGGVEADQPLGIYLRYLGVLDRLTLLPLDIEGYDRVTFPTVDFTIPAGHERFERALSDRFPHERDGIRRYFADIAAICDGFAFYRVRAEENQSHALRWLGAPLGPYLRERFSDPDLMRVLTGQSPLYGVEPERTPIALHALVTDSFMLNPYALQGGGDALAKVMVDRIRELGGDVHTRRRVTAIELDSERVVSGVTTDRGERFEGRLVISCAHPKATLRLLPDNALRPGFRRRVLGLEDGISTLSLFVTTRVDLSAYRGRNIYRYEIDDIDALYTNRDRPPEFVFGTVPTAREGPAPGGVHQVIGLGFLSWGRVAEWEQTRTGERPEAYAAFKEEHGSALLRLLERAIPEIEGRVESLEVATPLTNRDYTGSERGAAYGVHHSVGQSGLHGLRSRTRVRGLYLTGQSVLMPGVCGVTVSAFHTCAQILGTEYLINKVKQGG